MGPSHHALQFDTDSVEATRSAGAALGAIVRPGDVISLDGDLGAGKTVLVSGVAAGMGVEAPVTSPTFNILVLHRGEPPLAHFDLYRLEHAEQLEDIDFWGVAESGVVSCVEWGEKFAEVMPPDRLVVEIRADGGSRTFLVAGTGERSSALAGEWLGKVGEAL
ncbi:MAG: tRNA (adenosine(37)-N6)-threonylcarbamoyltransferase complex ATPase subunit type 1 TsaE [Coriobacteriia bacterium]